MSLIYHTSIQETLNHQPFNGCIISFDLLPKVCAPTSSIQIVISLAQQVIINHPTSPSPSTFPPSSTFCHIFMYHMYILCLPKLILQECCIVHHIHVYCQGTSETGNVLCPSTCGAPTYLWNGHSRG